jgi:hypothetical protein
VIAGHVVAEGALQMFDQGRHARGGFPAVERGRNHRMVLAGTVLPGHDFVRVGLVPPIGRVAAEAREEQGARVGGEDLRAEIICGLPVRRLPGRGPGHVYGKADEIHSCSGGHADLGFKGAGRAAQKDEGVAGAVEGDGEVARRFGPRPERDAVALAADDGQFR